MNTTSSRFRRVERGVRLVMRGHWLISKFSIIEQDAGGERSER